MTRFMGAFAVLVLFVAILFWAAAKGPAGSSTAPAAGVQVNAPVLSQAQLDTSTTNAQETATADILFAHDRATSRAATSTQNAAQTQAVLQQTEAVLQQTQAMLQQTQAQFNLRLAADSATESAGATATQLQKDESAAGTTTAIAGVISTQTQSAIATQLRHADQVRQSEVQQQDTIAFLWTWGPPLLVLAVAAVCVWAFWYWEIHKRIRWRPSREPAAPVFADPLLDELPLPAAEVVIDPDPITEPDGQVSGWLEEVKEKLLTGEKDDHVDPNA